MTIQKTDSNTFLLTFWMYSLLLVKYHKLLGHGENERDYTK